MIIVILLKVNTLSATEEESTLMEDDNVTNTQFEEVSSAEMTQGNMDTMLTENIPNIIHVL